ncbi:MAG: alpha/beta hydrolase [Spirochaetaceae bacterium]
MLDYRTRTGGGETVVMLHGFGADSSDLYPLAAEMDGGGRYTWHFPQAPHRIRYGGSAFGSAWFPRNDTEVAAALEGGYFHRLEAMDPEGLRQAGAEVLELVGSLGVDFGSVVLGGFSQGAMVAVEAVVQAERHPADLLIFSGSIIAAERWRTALSGSAPFAFFQSHGTADPILPLDGARRLRSLLEQAGGEGEFVQFDGGHGIPPEVMGRVGARLERRRQGSR